MGVLISEIEVGDSYFNKVATETAESASKFDASKVRRPLRGIQFKKDTFATISVWGAHPGQANSVAANAGRGGFLENSSVQGDVNFSTNFLLQSVSETRTEKFQPMPTFGNAYGFFFGEQPRMVTYSAILLNTADFQWEIEWWDNYENYLRGTKLVERGERAYIYYDDRVVEGYLLNAMTVKNANDPRAVMVNFTMFVTNVIYSITPGDTKFPTGEAGGIPAEKRVLTSTTAAVRQSNLDKIVQGHTGFLSGLRNALSNFGDAVGGVFDGISHKLEAAIDFLYGRNILVPAGYETTELASLAAGSQAIGLGDDTFDYVRIKVPSGIVATARPRGHFYHNEDEYIGFDDDPDKTAEELASYYKEYWGTSLDPVYDQAAKAAANLAAQARVEGIFESEGVGYGSGDLVRAIGSAAFLAVSIASNILGNTGQSVAEAQLINIGEDGSVGLGPSGGTEAARAKQEQAAAEADGW
jgi:hypothetical protein